MDINISSSVCQKSFYDWVLVVVPIFISGIVAYFGYLQYVVNRHKFRLDLYNRRFAVYEASISYYLSYYYPDASGNSIDNSARDFVRVYSESVFLFGVDSAVYQVLTELKDTLGFLIQTERKRRSESWDEAESKAWSSHMESNRSPEEIMSDLRNSLLPWLDFKKIVK